jgi:pyruvate-formate lyase
MLPAPKETPKPMEEKRNEMETKSIHPTLTELMVGKKTPKWWKKYNEDASIDELKTQLNQKRNLVQKVSHWMQSREEAERKRIREEHERMEAEWTRLCKQYEKFNDRDGTIRSSPISSQTDWDSFIRGNK